MRNDELKELVKTLRGLDFTVIDLTDMVGDMIICDLCNKDWTGTEQTGGLVFSSTGVCPDCEPEFRRGIARHKEEHAIVSECPKDMSHSEFILRFRKGERFNAR